jgi:hypothetical protein
VVNLSRQLIYWSSNLRLQSQRYNLSSGIRLKQYTDPEAEDFTPVLQALRDRDRQIEATRFSP